MQANDRDSEMVEEVRGRGNPKLANGKAAKAGGG